MHWIVWKNVKYTMKWYSMHCSIYAKHESIRFKSFNGCDIVFISSYEKVPVWRRIWFVVSSYLYSYCRHVGAARQVGLTQVIQVMWFCCRVSETLWSRRLTAGEAASRPASWRSRRGPATQTHTAEDIDQDGQEVEDEGRGRADTVWYWSRADCELEIRAVLTMT